MSVPRRAILKAARSSITPRTVRWALQRAAGLRIDTRGVSARTVFTGPVTIGRGSFINRDCLFDASAPITLGERVAVGMGCALITSTHELAGPAGRAGALGAAPISIGTGSWLGARVTVLPGVTIGEGCVVAAGAVVTKDLAPHGLYAGVPARLIRDLESAELVGASVEGAAAGPRVAVVVDGGGDAREDR